MQRKICVVSGSRADYGLLRPVMKNIRQTDCFRLQVIACCMHLSEKFGYTYRNIEKDGFFIDEMVDMLQDDPTALGVAVSMGKGTIGFAHAFSRLVPDLLLVLGDRFEILSAVQAALVMKIPVAHLCGGDTTEGAYDEAIRHSITKMSHIHFTTNHESAGRVRQLGENPGYVFNVGSPGIDGILDTELPGREEFERSINFRLRNRNVILTYHPVTLGRGGDSDKLGELLAAVDSFGDELGIIITCPNADNGGEELFRMINEFSTGRDNVTVHKSLGRWRYYCALSLVDAVVGNSSSGLYEAPTFKVPAVNIGQRQQGRLRCESVIDCGDSREEIITAIRKAFEMDCSGVENPYGQGDSARAIVELLQKIPDFSALLRKRFYPV